MDRGTQVRQTLVLAAIVLGLATTIYGAWAHALYAQRPPPWSHRGLIAWLAVVGVAGSCGAVLAYRSVYWRQWVAVLGLGYASVAVGVGPLAGVVLLALTAWAVGALVVDDLLRVRSVDWSPATPLGAAIRLTAGAACLIAIVQFAAHWPVNHAAAYVLLLSGALVICKPRIAALTSALRMPAPASSMLEAAAAGLLTITLALHLAVSAKPEVGHDALTMHLLIPAYVADHLKWHFDVTRGSYAVMPLAASWYFTLGYMLGGEFGARLANLCLILVCGLWISGLLEGRVEKTPRRILVALYFSTPLLGLTTGSLFSEHLWSLMLLAAAGVAFCQGLTYPQRWMLSALMLAVALATKVLAVFALPVFFAAAIVQRPSRATDDGRRTSLTWIACLLIVAVIGGWPYWTALAKTGNPVFPIMNTLFKSPLYPVEAQHLPFGGGLRLSTLYHMTFDSGKYLEAQAGAAGFQWLMFLPAALIATVAFRCWTLIGYWAIAASLIVGIVPQQAYLRYLEPATAFLTLTMAGLLSRQVVGPRVVKCTIAMASVVTLANAFFFATSGWYHRNLVELDFARYVTDSVPERRLVNVLNTLAPGAPAIFLGRYFAAGLQARSVSDVHYFPTMVKELASIRSEREFAAVLLRHGIEYVIGTNAAFGRYGIRPAGPHPVFDFVASRGDATLLRIKPDIRFTEERLRNPDFVGRLDGWEHPSGIALPQGGVRVTLRNHLTQVLAVRAGERYLVSLKVRCASPGIVRLQVNWLDASGTFVGTFLSPKECHGDQVFSEIAEVPDRAVTGVYYVGAHDDRPVDVAAASFKR